VAAELPTGTVTFLFTDLESSTRLWEEQPDAMRAALARHDEILRDAIEGRAGRVVKSTGDGLHGVFGSAEDALRAAAAGQVALAAERFEETGPLRVRMGIHTGTAELRDGDYFGPALNRAARLMAVGHGGQVLVSLATEQLVTGFELRDLGEHQLRDLSRPERVFQLCHVSLPASFPALRSLDSYPTNLPAQMTAFVGREREMRETASGLAEHRVVTLTGVGGVGKTRLALQVAAEVLPEFPDGVFVVELGGVMDEAAVPESLATALLVRQQQGQTIAESLLSFLGNKHLLLVLDNCEHLLEPIARLVSQILSVAPDVGVLATSREALRVDGEQVMTVPSLALPEDTPSPDDAAAAEAVRLFVDRARAIRPEFSLTADNAAAVAQLCRRLDGVPLAIELAAARIGSMAPNEITARLDQRFRLLTGGTRTAASRHQTLRRAIDWSYEALEPAEQTLLGRLSVCLGGFDLAAAEAIGTGGTIDAFDVDDALGRLVGKSLVLATDLGDTTRYKMLETIREYALERLEATGETPEIRAAHAEHYTALAEEAGAGLKGPHERAWLSRVEDELDNLRAAVMWSLATGETGLACACVRALGLQGLRIEPAVSGWADSILECSAAQKDPAYPAALAVAGWAKIGEGSPEDASRLVDEALAGLDRTPPQAATECRVLSCTTGMASYLGRDPTAQAQRWSRAAETAGDDYETALACTMVAVAQSMTGDPAALATAEEAVRLARKVQSPSAIAYSLLTTAMVQAPTDPTRALDLLDESQRSATAAGNTFAAITATGIQNALLVQSGHYEAAARGYLDAAQQAYQYGRQESQGIMLANLAGSLAAQGRLEPAAVLVGWVESVLPWASAAPASLYFTTLDRINQLPDVIGAARSATLHASGAAMSAAEILSYVERILSGSAAG
jgi:predicted ATPase